MNFLCIYCHSISFSFAFSYTGFTTPNAGRLPQVGERL
nr:MAG TPA: cytochrome C6 [Caudoviricetes sp.]